MNQTEKKRLWIYIAIAYGVMYLMSIGIYIAYRKEYDTTAFVNTQMLYPACGVVLGKLICKKEGEKLPFIGYLTLLITTALMMICSLLSLVIHYTFEAAPGQTVDLWNLVTQYILITGSVVAYVFFWVCGKEKRDSAGLSRKNIKWSIIIVAIFIALLIGRVMLGVFITDLINHSNDAWVALQDTLKNYVFWVGLASLPFNFINAWLAFFGEEYGWRYYLQPIMQKKFGLRGGVLLLGLVWAVWHIVVDFLFYADGYGPQAFVTQIVTCVSIAIFFGFAYLKTENIWVPVILHFLNNNLVALFAGGGNALQNQVIEWKDIPLQLLVSVGFILFILAPVYNKRKEAKAAEEAKENTN